MQNLPRVKWHDNSRLVSLVDTMAAFRTHQEKFVLHM